MPYLLDSDILIYYTNGIMSIHELFDRIAIEGIAICAISYMETQQGIGRSPHPQDAQYRLDSLLEWVPIIAFSRREAHRCANVRENTPDEGTSRPPAST